MRPKKTWSKMAVKADILRRLGTQLSKTPMWEKYLFIVDTTDEGCELAEKAAELLLLDKEIKALMLELDEFYEQNKTTTRD